MRFILLFLVVVLLLISKNSKKSSFLFVIFSALLLILFSTFRQYISNGAYAGNDYFSYNNWFNLIENLKLSVFNDFLFNILMLIIKRYFNSFIFFLFVVAIFQIYAIYKFAYENSDDYFYCIYVFLAFGIYDLGLSAIRQFIALSFFLLSFKQIKDKKFFKYFIYIILASMFHSSAIILLLVYPFINVNISIKKKIFLLIFMGIAFTFFIHNGLYERFLINYIPGYIYKYENIGSELNSNYTVLLISLLLIIADYFLLSKKRMSRSYNDTIYCYILLLCLFSYLATLHATLGRTLVYFMPSVSLMVPNMFLNIKEGDGRKIGKVVLFIIFLLIFIL